MDAFLPIRAYDDYVSAHIALGRLEEEGIRAWLKDEHTISVDPGLTYAAGGIKLMVRKEQASRAAQTLRTIENLSRKNNPCPHCGSTDVEPVVPRRSLLAWFLALFGTAPDRQEYRCFSCDRTFAADRDPGKKD
jgi:hypothetical protein